MDFKHKDGAGIFKNFTKKENQPDYKGSGTTLSGKDVDIAAWVKTAKDGQNILALVGREAAGRDKKKTPEPEAVEQNDLLFSFFI